MRIAIDTLFERGDNQASSAVDYLVNLCSYLPQAGPEHQYFILVGRHSAHRYKHLVRENVHLVDCVFANDYRMLRILTQQSLVPIRLRQLKIDALFAAGNVCPLIGQFCRVLKINTLHHFSAPQMLGRAKSTYRKVAFGLSARAADRIVANSSATRDDICSLLKVDPDKVTTVWEAVDDSFMPASDEAKQRLIERLNLHRPFLLFSSTLWPYKNAHTLLRAYGNLVRNHGIQSDLVFAGRTDEISYRKQLDEIVREERLAKRVHFLGLLPNREMPALYSAATMLVYPSLSETFGKPLVEAMRCGLPVIASNASCIPEILGGAGLLIDPNDAGDISKAIYRVLTDDVLRRQLIERGRERGQAFSWEESARQTLNVIESSFEEWRPTHRTAAYVAAHR